MPRQFHIVDVFAQERYAGNQLAVVTDAGDLDGEQMQAIAAEIDYSETTFVTGRETDDGWPVRIFTPVEEVPVCRPSNPRHGVGRPPASRRRRPRDGRPGPAGRPDSGGGSGALGRGDTVDEPAVPVVRGDDPSQ